MQTIQLNDFKLQWETVRQDFVDCVERVGKSGYLILGGEVAEFEKALSHFWGIPHVIGCASGLDAIELGLRSLDLKPGDKVLTTPLSAFATTLAIFRSGGQPVFCDTDESGLIDLDLVEDLLMTNPEIKFLVPVHLFGHTVNLKRLLELKKRFGLKIIEDCAQSIGSKSFGLPTGTVGDLAATSFYPTKNLGCYGDGGAVLTIKEVFTSKVRSLRDYGQTEKYQHSLLGLNSRLDELQAAFLRTALLPRLSQWTERRKEIALRYLQGLNHPLLKAIKIPEGSSSCWHLFPIRTPQRESLKKWLALHQIQTAVHYPILIPNQSVFDHPELFGKWEVRGDLKNAMALTQEELSLPIHPFLTDTEVERVIEVCNDWKETP